MKLRAEAPDGAGGSQPAISEELLARLKAAEAEAQRLKVELADAKAQAVADGTAPAAPPPLLPATKRIDSGDLRRETLAFVGAHTPRLPDAPPGPPPGRISLTCTLAPRAESKERNWLNETDMDFFTGGGPSEAEGAAAAGDAEGAVVRRRVLIGLGLTAALGAFALVPTEKLQAPPSKPLFFYLVPLIRVQARPGGGRIVCPCSGSPSAAHRAPAAAAMCVTQGLLEECEGIIPGGDYEQLRAALARIQGAPNNVQDNLRAAAVCEPAPPAAPASLSLWSRHQTDCAPPPRPCPPPARRSLRQRSLVFARPAAALEDPRKAAAADVLARDVYEYVRGIDYQTYYDSISAPGSRGGSAKRELFEYSLKSAGAARAGLAAFLALMPREQVEAAQQQVASAPF